MRILLATLAGTVIYYVWGMVAWMLFPLHTPTLNQVPEEESLQQFIADQKMDPGYYIVPWMPGSSDSDAFEEFTRKHKQGPILTVIVAEGTTPMPPSTLVKAVVMDFIAALIVAFILCSATCCEAYWKRVGLTTGMGLFAAVISHGALWNWMYYPLDYTMAMCIDVIVGWTLAGLAMAAIIKPDTAVTVGG